MTKQNFLEIMKNSFKNIFSKNKKINGENYFEINKKNNLKESHIIYDIKKKEYLKKWKELDENSKYHSTEFVKNLPEKFRDDRDIMLQCVRDNVDNLKYVSSELKDNKEFILNILKNNNVFVISGGEEVDGEPIAFHSVIILNNVSERLRNDKDIVSESIKSDSRNIKFMADELKNNKDFILEITNNSKGEWFIENYIRHVFSTEEKPSLAYLPKKFQDNKEIVLSMIEKDVDNLKFVSDRLKNDNDFIVKALKINTSSENFLKENLINNKDKNVLLARSYVSFFELGEEQKNDKDLALKVLSNNGHQLKYYTSEEIKSDKNIVLNAIKNNPIAFKWASNKLKNDKNIALVAMKRGMNLKYASDKLKDDFDVVMTAVKSNYNALEYASDRLKNNKEILQEIESTKNFDKAMESYWQEYITGKIETFKDNTWTDKINSDKASNLER